MAHVGLGIRRTVLVPSHSALEYVARGFRESDFENVVLFQS